MSCFLFLCLEILDILALEKEQLSSLCPMAVGLKDVDSCITRMCLIQTQRL